VEVKGLMARAPLNASMIGDGRAVFGPRKSLAYTCLVEFHRQAHPCLTPHHQLHPRLVLICCLQHIQHARTHKTNRQARLRRGKVLDRGTRSLTRLIKGENADVMQSAVYGKCIFADYNNVHKDMCAKEFMKLKECYLVSLSVQERLGECVLIGFAESV